MPWVRPSSGTSSSPGGGITSVNGQTGPAVVLTATDVGAAPTDLAWDGAALTLTAYPPAVVHDPTMSQTGDNYFVSIGGTWLASGAPGSIHDLTILTPPSPGGMAVIVIAYPTSSGEYGYCGVGIVEYGGNYWTCIPTITWDGGFSWYAGLSSLLANYGPCPQIVRWDHGTGTVWIYTSAGSWVQATEPDLSTLLPRNLAATGPAEAVGLGVFQLNIGGPPATVSATLSAGVPLAELWPASITSNSAGELGRMPTPEGLLYPWVVPGQASSGASFNMPLGTVGQQSMKAMTQAAGQTAIGLQNLTINGQMEYALFGQRWILSPPSVRGQVLRGTPGPLGVIQSWETEGYTQDMWRSGSAAGRWYPVPFSAGGATALATAAIPTNTIRAFPLVLGQYHDATGLAINVTTAAAGGEMRFGLYTDLNGYPDTLVYDAGAVSTATTGVKSITGFFITLAPGARYWVTLWGVGAPTCRAQPLGNLAPILGVDAALGTAFGVGWTAALTYTAGVSTYPLTFPAGASVLTASSPTPFIQI